MKNNILNNETDNFALKKIYWPNIQTEMKNKFGKDIYESWIRKIAQCHWSFADLRSGECWQHMKRYLKI